MTHAGKIAGTRFVGAAITSVILAGIVLFAGRASAAEFAPTCQEFIVTMAKTNGTAAPAPTETAKLCDCIAAKMSDDDKPKAAEALGMIVEAGKTGKAGTFSDEQKAAMTKFGEANRACP